MDELIEVIEEYNEIQFFISLDYSSSENELYSCSEWADLYDELGEHGNNQLILEVLMEKTRYFKGLKFI